MMLSPNPNTSVALLSRRARGLGILAFLALAAAACGSSESSTGGDPGGGASGGSGGSGAGQTTGQQGGGGQTTTNAQGGGGGQTTTGEGGGGNTGGGGGTPEPVVPFCVDACSSAADCVFPNAVPAQDVDNYACEGSKCVYTGCKSDSECTDSYGAGYKCGIYPGGAVKFCYDPCSSVADCLFPNAVPAQDADNYACQDTFCVYTGCNSDSECTDSYGAGYKCGIYPGGTVKFCYDACSSVADCLFPNAVPAQDADNYACQDTFCVYTGCNSDSECTDSYGAGFICK